jgi:hypothetical protein
LSCPSPLKASTGSAISRHLCGSRKYPAAGLCVEFENVSILNDVPNDVVLELLVCLGQALWERVTPAERTDWLQLSELNLRLALVAKSTRMDCEPSESCCPVGQRRGACGAFSSMRVYRLRAQWRSTPIACGMT